MNRVARSFPLAFALLVAGLPGLTAQDAPKPAEKPAATEPAAGDAPKLDPLATKPGKLTDGEVIPENLTGDVVADTKFYYSIGRHDKALSMIEGATDKQKEDPELRFTKANILALRREWAPARTIYEGLLTVWPDTSTIGGLQTRFNLAEVYYVLGEHQKALELYDQIWEVSKDKKDNTVDYLRYKMFLTNLVLGNTAKSDEIYQTFDEYAISAPSYYYATAAKAFKAGRVDEGKDWIRSAWSIYNDVLNNAFNEALLESTLIDRKLLEDQG